MLRLRSFREMRIRLFSRAKRCGDLPGAVGRAIVDDRRFRSRSSPIREGRPPCRRNRQSNPLHYSRSRSNSPSERICSRSRQQGIRRSGNSSRSRSRSPRGGRLASTAAGQAPTRRDGVSTSVSQHGKLPRIEGLFDVVDTEALPGRQVPNEEIGSRRSSEPERCRGRVRAPGRPGSA